MAKKILTKKDFNSLLKGKAVSVEYCGYSLGFELKDKSINMIDLSSDYVIFGVEAKSSYDVCYLCLSGAFEGYADAMKDIESNKEVESNETLIDENKESNVEPEALPQVNTEHNALDDITSEIVKSLSVAGVAQLNVALLIRTVYERKLYELGNYPNIYDYCADKFGIARGTTSNWLMVATNFGEYNEEHKRYYLDSRLEGYTITQLIIMRGMTVAEILANTIPAMTCKQIKEIAKLFDKHVTENGKIVAPDIDDVETGDDYEDEDVYNDVDEIAETSSGSKRKPKFTCSIKGGTAFENSSQVAIIAKMIRDAVTSKTFNIEIYVE